MTKRRVIFVICCAWLLIVMVSVSMRIYSQHRPIKIYVARRAPMPAELASGLHMKEHGINSAVTIESSYEDSEDKILSLDEINRVRSQIVWNPHIPLFYDSLTIQSSNSVLIRRTTKSVMRECELAKSGDRWRIESSTESTIMNGDRQ